MTSTTATSGGAPGALLGDSHGGPAWRPKVVVAEPRPECRVPVAEVLRVEGYGVAEASTGFELFDLLSPTLLELEPTRYDMVLMAVALPGWSGVEILRGVRRSDWSTPCVLIAEFCDRGLHQLARRLGGFVLDRPITNAELLDYVRCVVPPPGALRLTPFEELLAWDEPPYDAEAAWLALEEQLRRDGVIKGTAAPWSMAP